MKYYEAYDKGQAIVKKFIDQLRGYGYADVISNNYPSQTDSGYRLTNSICLYFWKGNFGYSLSISDKNEHWKLNEVVDYDTFIATCEKIIPFVRNASVLECDYTKEFGEYLKLQGIIGVKNCQPQISEDYAIIGFHSEQYRIFLDRININATLNSTLAEPDDYDEDFPEKPEKEDYGYLESEIIKTILDSNLPDKYKFETIFEWNRIGLSIYDQVHRYNLYIEPTLSYDEMGYQITSIVNCFIRQIINNTTNLFADLDNSIFHKHSQSSDGLTAIVCLGLDIFAITAWSESIIGNSKIRNTLLSSKPAFDSMNGGDFEEYCATLLRYNGFVNITLTKTSGDQGIDIIAYKDSIKYGIQCKCYTADIGNKAVQEVFAGRTFYNCDVGIVLTNRYFTKSAVELAKKNRIHLWDRDKLIELSKAISKI